MVALSICKTLPFNPLENALLTAVTIDKSSYLTPDHAVLYATGPLRRITTGYFGAAFLRLDFFAN